MHKTHGGQKYDKKDKQQTKNDKKMESNISNSNRWSQYDSNSNSYLKNFVHSQNLKKCVAI